MKFYTTEIWAVDPRQPKIDPSFFLEYSPDAYRHGDVVKWDGPKIQARNLEEAEQILIASGMGYCRLTGDKWLGQIDQETGKDIFPHETPWIYHN